MKQLNLPALRELFRQVLQLPDGSVRDANDGLPTEAGSYVTVEYVGDLDTAVSSRLAWNSNTEAGTATTTYVAHLSTQAYGNNANQLLRKLRALLVEAPVVKSELRKLKCGLLYAAPVRDISGVAVPGYEERAVLDLHVGYVHAVSFEVREIRAAAVTVISDPGGTAAHVEV